VRKRDGGRLRDGQTAAQREAAPIQRQLLETRTRGADDGSNAGPSGATLFPLSRDRRSTRYFRFILKATCLVIKPANVIRLCATYALTVTNNSTVSRRVSCTHTRARARAHTHTHRHTCTHAGRKLELNNTCRC